MRTESIARRLTAEFLGTGLLLATVVGSGIMGERLAGGNIGIALLANSLATGAALISLILSFGPISGAHFNPVVTIAEGTRRRLPLADVGAYIVAQVLGACCGVVLAHLMFALPPLSVSHHARTGVSQVLSEAVATFGLLATILGSSRRNDGTIAIAVGAYITAAYWFTASTSFANPAVTIARACTGTFAGIRLGDVAGFLLGQSIGATIATMLFAWLLHEPSDSPERTTASVN
jgi:glycerol uptake facilitator-like aquaporin